MTSRSPIDAWALRCVAGAVMLSAMSASGVRAQDSPPPRDGATGAAEARVVRVTVAGRSRDDALKQALRRALEQAAGGQIDARSDTRDGVLLRGSIYSQASAIVRDYRVLEERPRSDGVELTVEATVRPGAVASAWAELQHVLDQLGRPKIMVWIDETIDGRRARESIVESRIEQMFLKAGFDLVERRAVAELRTRETADALDEQNAARAAQLAKDAGAHILIRGAASADRAGIADLYGVPAPHYNCTVQAKVYAADSGRLLASESLPVTRAGARGDREYSPQAAAAALARATFPDVDTPRREPPLADRLFSAVMEQWSTQLTTGGDIDLEVEGLDFRGFAELRKTLADLPGVRSVDGDFAKGIGSFRIKAQLTAAALAERLAARPFDVQLEVVELKPTRIVAKRVGP
ncbi:MAG: hypothetical protein AB7Q17_15795 [Phycisphaerae bacterium]